MMIEYEVGQVVRHFKAEFNCREEEQQMKYYYVITALPWDETEQRFAVVYQALYGDHMLFVRSLSEFSSLVDVEKYPEVKQKHRFEVVT